MNVFDAVLVSMALLAAGLGYRSGLLRSLAIILGYAIAAPLAIALTPLVAFNLPGGIEHDEIVFFGLFLAAGILLGALMRNAVGELAGAHIGIFDRMAGAALGVVRIGLVGVLLVLIFELIIPQDRQPAWLTQSQLRPYLLAAGQSGLRSLPPDVTEYIERIRRERAL